MWLVATAFAVLLAFTALLAWFNERFVRIPTTVGVTLAGALASLLLIGLDKLGLGGGLRGTASTLLETLDFTDFVLNGILSLLLFAGALSLDARRLLAQRASILVLAVLSTLLSTVVIGGLAYLVFQALGIGMPLIWAMLFGALISPTDPVAVLDLLKRAKVPAKIQTLIAGEALFNDGVGVVVFLTLGGVAGIGGHEGPVTAASVAATFATEALGGIAFGAVVGYLCYLMCASIENTIVEVLITLATTVGGYLAAAAVGISGPLAMVVAGLIMSAGAHRAFVGESGHEVQVFWETLDSVLNIVLFTFIGLDVLLTPTSLPQVVAGVVLIGVALFARWVSVALPMPLVRQRDGYGAWTVRLLTWGGLRGGIAISLALGLPENAYRSSIVTATYAVVLFTIAVQGLTVMPIVRKAVAADEQAGAAAV